MFRFIQLILLCVLFFVSGCSNSLQPKDLPKLYSCVITITQEGKPLDGATVELVVTDHENSKYKSLAITDVEGKAIMSTYGHNGVPVGKYKAVVTKEITDDIVYKENESGGKDLVSYKKYKMVEEQFSDPQITSHEIEITGKGKVAKTFDVGKAIRQLVK
ncbi:MAG: hypothetical protein LBU65_02675 [Planctomycetaceae bacterium]|jgi:hypothetical protein|nr:hypothetical protein [Planctomycetaceae bacterium]